MQPYIKMPHWRFKDKFEEDVNEYDHDWKCKELIDDVNVMFNENNEMKASKEMKPLQKEP